MSTAHVHRTPDRDGAGEAVVSVKNPVRAIAAATIGNALEWFDIAIYALFAIYIGQNFFPSADPGVQLVQTFAVFGVSYLIRPLGGLILGSYADRKGRKKALVMSIRLMVLGTALIAFMPNYDDIGILAPIGIIVARLIQGFAAGGEFGAATSFLVEQNGKRRGFFGSFQFASQGLATLMAASFAAGLTAVLSEASMVDWGWRVPFVFGLMVGPVGWFIRRHVDESPAVVAASGTPKSPVRDLFRNQWGGILIAGGVLVVSTALNFILQYLPTFGIKQLGLNNSLSFVALMITGVILTVVTPFVGQLSDKVGRIKIMLPSAIAIGVSVVPLFMWLIAVPSFLTLALVMTVLGLLKALYFGALPSVMSDAFPVHSRATGLSFGYNVTTAIFGGFTPTIAAALVAATGQAVSPGYYILAVSLVSIAALIGAVRIRGIR
ncbi:MULTISPECIES: MFS transporter [Nocardiaceae]|uniref:MFS transporter n=1 Tax=Nocardiaceae TaxID=85025 RepID=UPI0007AAD8A2|nr:MULTISPECIES: MFS transporter [Rhodococcus]AMY53635.1 Proline/betaine transporter [Rhodococcus fascians D188]OZD46252.1 MFS transporter [Rhodococcus sp. 06-1474-1B]